MRSWYNEEDEESDEERGRAEWEILQIEPRRTVQPSLYQRLKRSSQDNIVDKMKLNALLATLDQFEVKTAEERELCAEMLLKLELKPVLPADDKMKKLMAMCRVFKDKQ